MKTMHDFAHWAEWYQDYQGRQLTIPWDDPGRLPASLRGIVGPSVAQFELGESSEATSLKAKVARYVRRGGDRHYQTAMDWFIHEENRHARMLGRWMDIEGLPKLKAHPADWFFRQFRRWVPLRYSLMILVSAEMLAVGYYQALRDIGPSTILATISRQILLDEDRHLHFQAMAIRTLLGKAGNLRLRLERAFARLLLEAATDVLWFHHGRFFQEAGWRYGDLRACAQAQFGKVWRCVETGAFEAEPAAAPALAHSTTTA